MPEHISHTSQKFLSAVGFMVGDFKGREGKGNNILSISPKKITVFWLTLCVFAKIYYPMAIFWRKSAKKSSMRAKSLLGRVGHAIILPFFLLFLSSFFSAAEASAQISHFEPSLVNKAEKTTKNILNFRKMQEKNISKSKSVEKIQQSHENKKEDIRHRKFSQNLLHPVVHWLANPQKHLNENLKKTMVQLMDGTCENANCDVSSNLSVKVLVNKTLSFALNSQKESWHPSKIAKTNKKHRAEQGERKFPHVSSVRISSAITATINRKKKKSKKYLLTRNTDGESCIRKELAFLDTFTSFKESRESSFIKYPNAFKVSANYKPVSFSQAQNIYREALAGQKIQADKERKTKIVSYKGQYLCSDLPAVNKSPVSVVPVFVVKEDNIFLLSVRRTEVEKYSRRQQAGMRFALSSANMLHTHSNIFLENKKRIASSFTATLMTDGFFSARLMVCR